MLRCTVLGLAVCIFCTAGELTDRERTLELQSFDIVWRTIRDTYWDPAIGGLDWNAAGKEFRGKVERAASRDESRKAMSELLRKLGQSHFAVVPNEAMGGQVSGGAAADIDIRVVDSRILVTRGNQAVQPGWQLRTVRGADMSAILNQMRALPAIVQLRVIRERLSGAPGEVIPAVFLDGRDQPVDVQLTLKPPSALAAGVGLLPPQPIEIETRTLPSGCGYLRFNWFLDPVRLIPAVEDAVKRFAEAPGLVLDLRGNPGGIGFLATGVAGWFVREQGLRLGTMRMREASLELVINPRLPHYTRPLAILVDEASASTSEILAAGLRDLKRARLFGTRTAGAALPSWIERLPNGDGFQYATADYVSVSGARLEGAGVNPDVAAPHTRALLLEGKDAALDAAVDWIKRGSK